MMKRTKRTKAQKTRARMICTAAFKLRRMDAGCVGAGQWDYRKDKELHRIVDELLADPSIRHINIPSMAVRRYCAE